MMHWFAFALLLLSGATALVYQVTWMRDLSLVFGASHEATALVLASFMGGLGCGGFALGRFSEKVTRPIRAYGLLELGVAFAALVMPAVFRGIDALYVGLVRSSGGESAEIVALRVALSFLAVCVPTFLMGGTLPLLVRAFVQRQEDLGPRLSWLYGFNTLGAALGAIATGFLLIPALGLARTQLAAVAVNIAIGLIAILIDRMSRAPAPVPQDSSEPGEASERAPLKPRASGPLRVAFWGTAVAGFCALALEVLWTRAITLAVGNTTYSVTVMLAAFLIGIWIGAWLRALLPFRRVDIALQMGLILSAIGATSFAASMLIPLLPEIMLQINASVFGESARVHIGTTLLVAFTLMLVPCVLMGVAFPIAGEIRARLVARFGSSVGDALSANTLGSIVGSLVAGFVLVPYLGIKVSAIAAALLYLAYGLFVVAIAMHAARRSHLRILLVVGLPAAAAVILIALVPRWDSTSYQAFSNNFLTKYSDAQGRVDIDAGLEGATVIHRSHGRSATVAVVERGGGRALLVNGKVVASDNLVDIPHELLLGHAPIMMHAAPKRVLVVGLGAGVTLAAVLAHPDVEHVTVVEIEGAVVEAARFFSHVNANALDDPRLRIVEQDGRNFLKTTHEQFDVITADPIHPWAAGAGYLYTREYYELAAQRLEIGGIMCQWIPGYELSNENFRSVAASFVSVFPESTLWQTSHDGVLVGAMGRLEMTLDDVGRRIAVPRVAAQLASIGLGDPLSFVAELALDRDATPKWAASAPINTDDNLYLEFSSPLEIGSTSVTENAESVDAFRSGPRTHLVDRDLPEGLLAAYQHAKSETVHVDLPTRGVRDSPEQRIDRLREVLVTVEAYGPAKLELAKLLAEHSLVALDSGKLRRARREANEAVGLAPDLAEARHARGTIHVREGRAAEAILDLTRATELRPRYEPSYRKLGTAHALAGNQREADSAFARAAEISGEQRPSSRSMQ
jgi:spermidine synthase